MGNKFSKKSCSKRLPKKAGISPNHGGRTKHTRLQPKKKKKSRHPLTTTSDPAQNKDKAGISPNEGRTNHTRLHPSEKKSRHHLTTTSEPEPNKDGAGTTPSNIKETKVQSTTEKSGTIGLINPVRYATALDPELSDGHAGISPNGGRTNHTRLHPNEKKSRHHLTTTSEPEPNKDEPEPNKDEAGTTPSNIKETTVQSTTEKSGTIGLINPVRYATASNPELSDGHGPHAWKKIDEHVSFDCNQRLGSNVFRGKFSYSDGETVDAAVKFVQKNDRSDREAHNLKNLNHPNVIKLLWYGDCKDQVHDFYVAVELCQKSLEQLMAEKEGPDYCRKNCQKIILDISDGLRYTHSKGIIHRDINPSNILLKADGNFVIADFDISKKPDDVNEQSMCSRGFHGYWSSPELLKGQGHSAKSDRYSVGLVLYWLLTGGKHAVEHRHVDGKTEVTGSPKTHLIDGSCCDDHEIARDLINQLLEFKPDDRIDLESLPKHPFFFSDDEKIQFLRSLYTEIEPLQKKLPKHGSEKARKKNIKQCLHQPAADIVGTNWSEKLKLDDDEMQKCFNGRRDPKNEKRHAIFNFVQPKKSDRDSDVQPKKSDRDPYKFDSPFSLVRLVRNIQTHKKNHKKDIQIILKTCGHWRFFSSRFPGLFMHVWNNFMDKSFHNVKELRAKYCLAPSMSCPAISEGQKKRSEKTRNRSSATTLSVQQSSPQNAEDANNNRSSAPDTENSVDASFHSSDFELLTHQTSRASIKDDNLPDPAAVYDSQNTERRQSQADVVNTQNVMQNADLELTQQSEKTVMKELWGDNTDLGTEEARAQSRESLPSTTPSGSENSRDLESSPEAEDGLPDLFAGSASTAPSSSSFSSDIPTMQRHQESMGLNQGRDTTPETPVNPDSGTDAENTVPTWMLLAALAASCVALQRIEKNEVPRGKPATSSSPRMSLKAQTSPASSGLPLDSSAMTSAHTTRAKSIFGNASFSNTQNSLCNLLPWSTTVSSSHSSSRDIQIDANSSSISIHNQEMQRSQDSMNLDQTYRALLWQANSLLRCDAEDALPTWMRHATLATCGPLPQGEDGVPSGKLCQPPDAEDHLHDFVSEERDYCSSLGPSVSGFSNSMIPRPGHETQENGITSESREESGGNYDIDRHRMVEQWLLRTVTAVNECPENSRLEDLRKKYDWVTLANPHPDGDASNTCPKMTNRSCCVLLHHGGNPVRLTNADSTILNGSDELVHSTGSIQYRIHAIGADHESDSSTILNGSDEVASHNGFAVHSTESIQNLRRAIGADHESDRIPYESMDPTQPSCNILQDHLKQLQASMSCRCVPSSHAPPPQAEIRSQNNAPITHPVSEIPSRFEDVFQEKIIPCFKSPQDFKLFARSRFGLELHEGQINIIEANRPYDAHQRMIDMLWLWKDKNPNATIQQIVDVKNQYFRSKAGNFRNPSC